MKKIFIFIILFSLVCLGSYYPVQKQIATGGNITKPAVTIHQDSGNSTSTYHKFTAGTTTGQTSSDGFDVGLDASGVGYIRQYENLSLIIRTNDTTRLNITGSGKVAIGASSATNLFEVNGSVDEIQMSVKGNATQTSNIIVFEKSDGTDLVQVTNTSGTNIRGTTTNDNAAAGFVGEYIESNNSSSTLGSGANSMPATTVIGCDQSIALTAGDWDISSLLLVRQNGATVTSPPEMWISTTSGNSATGRLYGSNFAGSNETAPTLGLWSLSVPGYRVSLSGSATYYLKCRMSYSAGTPQYHHRISARRVR
jgi:hypothetical protein